MKRQTLVVGSIVVVAVIAITICVGMVSGQSVFRPYISVDPAGPNYVGDSVIITGKTNLPVGSEILVEVNPASFEPSSGPGRESAGFFSKEFTGVMGTVAVTGGSNGINSYSFPFETKNLKSMDYVVVVSTLQGDLSKGEIIKGDVSGKIEFLLKENPQQGSFAYSTGTATKSTLSIEKIGEKKTGDFILLHGNTSLPGSTELVIDVTPAYFSPGSDVKTDPVTGGISSSFTGVKATVSVSNGENGNNPWSLSLNSSNLKSGDYVVSVRPLQASSGDMDVMAMTLFTLE